MCPIREGGEHRQRVIAVARLAMDRPIEHHGSIRREHRQWRGSRKHVQRLGTGEPQHVVLRALAGELRLIDVRGQHGMGDAKLREQLAAARRCRGEAEYGGGAHQSR